MPDEKTPETQDTSEKLIFGKYKTQEEAENAFKEMERRQSDLSEQLDRTTRFLELTQIEKDKEPEMKDTPIDNLLPVDENVDENIRAYLAKVGETIKETVKNEVISTIGKALGERERQKTLEDKFYGLHPDLKGAKRLVDYIAYDLRQELGNRPINEEAAIAEVAKRTRSELERFKKTTPPHLESSSNGEHNPTQKEKEFKLPSPEEALDEFIAEQRTRKAKQLGISTRG